MFGCVRERHLKKDEERRREWNVCDMWQTHARERHIDSRNLQYVELPGELKHIVQPEERKSTESTAVTAIEPARRKGSNPKRSMCRQALQLRTRCRKVRVVRGRNIDWYAENARLAKVKQKDWKVPRTRVTDPHFMRFWTSRTNERYTVSPSAPEKGVALLESAV